MLDQRLFVAQYFNFADLASEEVECLTKILNWLIFARFSSFMRVLTSCCQKFFI